MSECLAFTRSRSPDCTLLVESQIVQNQSANGAVQTTNMMQRHRIIIYAAFIATVAFSCPGCGASGDAKTTGASRDRFRELKPGMTPWEVIDRLGEPTSKGTAASAAMRSAIQRLPEFTSDLPPAFERPDAESNATENAGDPPEDEQWLFGPFRDLQAGDTLTLLEFSNGKLNSASRMTVVRPPVR